MNPILIIVLIYISYLLLWASICLISFTLSLVFKKPLIIQGVAGLSQIVVYLLNLILGIGIFVFTISLLFSGQFLWFLVMIFVGMGILNWALTLIQMPFVAIPLYFEAKIEEINKEPDYMEAEILDENNNVIQIIEPEKNITRKLAIYFTATYALNLFSLIKNSDEYPNYKFGDYITSPLLWTFSMVIFFSIFVGIFNLIKRKRFFYPRKKIFLTNVLKISTITLSILTVLFLIMGV